MISIIVPVYNAASYIADTITMVRKQSFSDWELILVNDCSKDQSLFIIENYLKKYPDERIKVIDKKVNEGAAKARNTGLDVAKGRYIAFLDADDLWYADKLKKEMQFMEKHEAGFVFSSYDYGDEAGVPNGKVAHVPATLNYKQALTRTVIFTSTVLIDTEIVDKSLIYMPCVPSEDTATWWQILKKGIVAYGLPESLAIYRRPRKSLSSDKGEAVKRIWNLYKNFEHLNLVKSIICMFGWAYRATVRRVISDVIWRYLEAFKRFTALQLSLFGIIAQTLLYAYSWFKTYYPILSMNRVSQDGYYFGGGLKLYYRGHILIITIYFVLFLLIVKAGNGMKTGYQLPGSIIFSQICALFAVNLVTYFQLSLLRNWLVPVMPLLKMYVVQVILCIVWTGFADWIYRRVFPPKEILVIEDPNTQPTDVIDAFNSRQDRFRIQKTIDTSLDIEDIKRECLYWYGAVILGVMSPVLRNELMDFCYSHYIRVYYVPALSDLMVYSSSRLELFETPVLELKEYSISWEGRIIKRVFDFVIGSICLILTSPVLLFKALKAKQIAGYAFMKDSYAGKGNRNISLYRFGNEEEPTALSMFISVLKGTVSIVGPRPVLKKDSDTFIEKDKRFFYRLRVKPGITGYAQVYGRKENHYTEDELYNFMKLDQIYIQRYSFGMDLKILMKKFGL